MMNDKCSICHRIDSKEFYDYVKKVCEISCISEENRRFIFYESIKMLNEGDKRDYHGIWCGRNKWVIMGGIVYTISRVNDITEYTLGKDIKGNSMLYLNKITQRDCAEAGNITVTSIRDMYIKIIRKIIERD